MFELLSKAVVESKQKVNIPKLSKEEPEEKEDSEKAKREEERGGAAASQPTGGPPPAWSDCCLPPPEPKTVEEMKGTDQEYSSALTQYNSSANSGGEDIELLAFQTVTGQTHRRQLATGGRCSRSALTCLLLLSGKCSETIFEDMREPPKKPLHLKGQMKYVPQWDSLIFLGTPM